MKYRQTFREALKDVGIKDKTEEKPVDDKDAIIQQLQLQLSTAVPPMPNPETGEVPLRTGIAAALLDKKGPSPKIEKDKKKEIKLSGKSKIEINPDVNIGQISGGIQTGTGNLH